MVNSFTATFDRYVQSMGIRVAAEPWRQVRAPTLGHSTVFRRYADRVWLGREEIFE